MDLGGQHVLAVNLVRDAHVQVTCCHRLQSSGRDLLLLARLCILLLPVRTPHSDLTRILALTASRYMSAALVLQVCQMNGKNGLNLVSKLDHQDGPSQPQQAPAMPLSISRREAGIEAPNPLVPLLRSIRQRPAMSAAVWMTCHAWHYLLQW